MMFASKTPRDLTGYTHVVHETYRDGFVWKHYAHSFEEADQIAEDLYAAHKGRTYHIERIEG